jgi:hypothetical protein
MKPATADADVLLVMRRPPCHPGLGRGSPGPVLAQTPAGGTARPPGAPVELTVAVDASGAGGLGVTLVPEVLGQPEATARQLLAQSPTASPVRLRVNPPGCPPPTTTTTG